MDFESWQIRRAAIDDENCKKENGEMVLV